MKLQRSVNQPQGGIFWVIWFLILIGLLLLQFFIGGGWPSENDKESVSRVLFLITVLPAFFSMVLRWLVLPQIKSVDALLLVMIIGLSLAEATGLLGLLVIGGDFPGTQKLTFLISIITVLQYIPVYLSNLKNR